MSALDLSKISNTRIRSIRPLLTPAELMAELPASQSDYEIVLANRVAYADALHARDDRLVVVDGPCSVADRASVMEFATRLARLKEQLEEKLIVLVRLYFVKPRSNVDWKGMIHDPDLDGSFNIELGLRLAREIMLDITQMGLGIATEFVDNLVPAYLADLVSVAGIGARTIESQLHRELTSGLSMPAALKNSTDGNITNAINAMLAAQASHSFIGIDEHGKSCLLTTTGNPDTHVMLRGGCNGPNYDSKSIEGTAAMLAKAGLNTRMGVDLSHDNSGKDHTRQSVVAESIMARRKAGNRNIFVVLAESNLHSGNQKLMIGPDAKQRMKYGVSITDKCMGWEDTEQLLNKMAESG